MVIFFPAKLFELMGYFCRVDVIFQSPMKELQIQARYASTLQSENAINWGHDKKFETNIQIFQKPT